MRALPLALVLALAPAAPALASSLPRVDFTDRPSASVGVGSNASLNPGGSLSLDYPLTDSLAIGGAASSNLLGAVNYDLRGMYRFVLGASGTGPTIGAILGVWGQPGNAAFQTGFGAAPFVGFGMAYPITDRWTARLDLAYAPFFDYARANEALVFLGGPPASGVEVGYRFNRNLEATLGINGRGDFLGGVMTF